MTGRARYGDPVLGYTPEQPRRVLYVDFENDPRGDVRERLINPVTIVEVATDPATIVVVEPSSGGGGDGPGSPLTRPTFSMWAPPRPPWSGHHGVLNPVPRHRIDPVPQQRHGLPVQGDELRRHRHGGIDAVLGVMGRVKDAATFYAIVG